MKKPVDILLSIAILLSKVNPFTAEEELPDQQCVASELYSSPAIENYYRLKDGNECKFIGGPMQHNQILEKGQFLCDTAPDTKWAFGITNRKPLRLVLINMKTGREYLAAKVPKNKSFLIQQGDGNLILREQPDGAVLWKSGTADNFGAKLSILCNGVLQITSYDDSHKIWTLLRKGCRRQTWMSNGDRLYWDEYLCWDDKMFGVDQNGKLAYWDGSTRLWPDGDLETGYMVMQFDGNLVARDEDEDALWASGTGTEAMDIDMRGAALILDNTGPHIKSTSGFDIYWYDWRNLPRRNLNTKDG